MRKETNETPNPLKILVQLAWQRNVQHYAGSSKHPPRRLPSLKVRRPPKQTILPCSIAGEDMVVELPELSAPSIEGPEHREFHKRCVELAISLGTKPMRQGGELFIRWPCLALYRRPP